MIKVAQIILNLQNHNNQVKNQIYKLYQLGLIVKKEKLDEDELNFYTPDDEEIMPIKTSKGKLTNK